MNKKQTLSNFHKGIDVIHQKRFLTPWPIFAILILCAPSLAGAAIADFCWTGFFVPSETQDGELSAEKLHPVFEKFFDTFEKEETGVLHKLLNRLRWDEMTYHGYVGVTRDNAGEKRPQMENLSSAYGFFLTVDQLLPFEPDEVTVFQKTFKTYASYIFGSLNLFNMETRNLVYSRPFFVIYQGEERLSPVAMVGFGLEKFAAKLADPKDEFTVRMQRDLQDYFGDEGEQKEALRMATGELKNTYGVFPVCERCVRTTEQDLGDESKRRLRTFARFFFNVKMSDYKQVVPVPEKQQKVQDSVHTFTVKTKEGDVRFSQSAYSGYDESGQTLLAVNIPEPANQVKLSLRYVIEKTPIGENAFIKKYNTILDMCVVETRGGKKKICSLPNLFKKAVTGSRKTSDVYYFNSLVNAISGLSEEDF